jgi:23S rRNA (pseudouridine1915-N3)-methyltransferase
MRIVILAIGRLREPFADDVAHYEKLLSRYARVEVVEIEDDQRLAKRIPDRAHVVLLDEGGDTYDSVGFSRWLEQRRQSGLELVFVIGGPFGVRLDDHDQRLSLGPMTLPFALARVVLLEQLYRGHKILAGEPYHH